MKDLLAALREFRDCYKGDPEGLNSDFRILTGFTILELTDKLSDEIDAHKRFKS